MPRHPITALRPARRHFTGKVSDGRCDTAFRARSRAWPTATLRHGHERQQDRRFERSRMHSRMGLASGHHHATACSSTSKGIVWTTGTVAAPGLDRPPASHTISDASRAAADTRCLSATMRDLVNHATRRQNRPFDRKTSGPITDKTSGGPYGLTLG